MDLQKRLATAANQNAQAIGKPIDPPSGEAVVTGRDKVTGQYIIKRNGALEMADSATNGALKIGVAVPAEQGKIFATPHQPRPKISYGFPHVAKANYKVYIACIPFVRGGFSGELDPCLAGNNIFYPASKKEFGLRDEYEFLGNNLIDGDYLLRMDRSKNYAILKELIDFVFRKDDGSSVSAEVMEEVINSQYEVYDANLDPLIYNFGYIYEGNYIALRKRAGGDRNFFEEIEIGPELSPNAYVTDRCRTSVNVINVGGLRTQFEASRFPANIGYPFFLKRFLKDAFKREGKTLIIIPPENMPVNGFAKAYDALQLYPGSWSSVQPNRQMWQRAGELAESLVERLIGATSNGLGVVKMAGELEPMLRESTLRGEAPASDYVEQPVDWTSWEADYFYFKGPNGLEYSSYYEWDENPGRDYYGAYRPVPRETFPAKDQSHFSRLLNALNDNVGPSLYVQRNRVFSGLNNKDRIQ